MSDNRHACGALAAVFTIALCTALPAARADGPLAAFEELPKEDKLLYTNIAVVGAITAWGIAKWDYGDNSATIGNEGWFGRDTKDGGADKLGHAYGTYVFSHGLGALYRHWGYDDERAARYGAFSAFGVQAFMEVGDSFSSYGFSWEDMVMNAAGAVAGYVFATQPELSRRVDFRVEYEPNFQTADIFTDYEHQKYLLAFKLDGFDTTRDTPLRFLELHLGYYARGYSQPNPALTERNVYAGVAVNLSRLFDSGGWHKTATLLRYYQPPYTSLQLHTDLND